MKLKVTCDKCGGSGMAHLDETLAETMRAIPRRGHVTAHSLHDNFPSVSPNAFNNRLERLRGLGLLKRERFGKFYHYSRA